jgi:G3E family GTPase
VLVLSKSDRAADLSEVKAEVQAINPRADCIPASFGDVDPAILQKSGTDHVFSSVATHDSSIKSFVLPFRSPVPRGLFERFLTVLVDLRGADLMRVKGIVALEGGEYVAVQGVRHVFDRLRPIAKSETGLVFITKGVEEREVAALWQAMSTLKGM